MMRATSYLALGVAVAMAAVACDRLPGVPRSSPAPAVGSEEWTRATFATHCRGCHASGAEGASIPLMDRTYWTFASDEHVIAATANGQGKHMPAFAADSGGPLSADEVSALARGMRHAFGGSARVEISATVPSGDSVRGESLFASVCGGCHRDGGTGGSLLDANYLSLISDQGIWASVLAGRRSLGMPAWNEAMPSRPNGLTQQEAADIVAWIASKRPARAGGTQ